MRVMFIDFEASGLGKASWPIEIGLAWISDSVVRVESSLIRRHRSWSMSAWSVRSSAVHHITRLELKAAPSAEIVADRFATMMQGGIVLSDAPEFDQMWLNRLLSVLPNSPIYTLYDFDNYVRNNYSRHALDAVYKQLDLSRAPHRAGEDAARLAEAWLSGLRR